MSTVDIGLQRSTSATLLGSGRKTLQLQFMCTLVVCTQRKAHRDGCIEPTRVNQQLLPSFIEIPTYRVFLIMVHVYHLMGEGKERERERGRESERERRDYVLYTRT